MATDKADTPGVIPPPLIPGTALGLALILQWLAPIQVIPDFTWFGALFWIGAAMAVCGLGLALWAVMTLRGAGTPVEPWHPTTALVRQGPYRLTRNPVYVSFLLVICGLSLGFSLDWGLMSVPFCWLALDRLVVVREERYLLGKFGDAYGRYLKETRQWL